MSAPHCLAHTGRLPTLLRRFHASPHIAPVLFLGMPSQPSRSQETSFVNPIKFISNVRLQKRDFIRDSWQITGFTLSLFFLVCFSHFACLQQFALHSETSGNASGNTCCIAPVKWRGEIVCQVARGNSITVADECKHRNDAKHNQNTTILFKNGNKKNAAITDTTQKQKHTKPRKSPQV